LKFNAFLNLHLPDIPLTLLRMPKRRNKTMQKNPKLIVATNSRLNKNGVVLFFLLTNSIQMKIIQALSILLLIYFKKS
jgi:hypothetical protein